MNKYHHGLSFTRVLLAAILSFTFVACDQSSSLRPDITKPRLPVNVSKRDALFGSGYVAQFTNESQRTLVINLVWESSSLHQRKESNLKIDAGKTEELGWAEGWTFKSGDTIIDPAIK